MQNGGALGPTSYASRFDVVPHRSSASSSHSSSVPAPSPIPVLSHGSLLHPSNFIFSRFSFPLDILFLIQFDYQPSGYYLIHSLEYALNVFRISFFEYRAYVVFLRFSLF